MKLLITGAQGQVGMALQHQAAALGWQVLAVDRDLLDITDTAAVQAKVSEFGPDAVINAAAYTAVDRAESEEKEAFAANRDGPAYLARACEAAAIPLVHYSTDYVFDGSKQGGYVESDTTSPLGVYGRSKLAGEEAVRQGCSRHLILRSSWVFSAHGQNFVKTMLRLGAEREELAVVADQHGKPTAAAEIARLTLALLAAGSEKWGTYHLAQPQATSWHGFAEEIFAEARRQGVALKVGDVRAITTAEYPTPARRPTNSELDCARVEAAFGITIRPWQHSLAEVIAELRCGTEGVGRKREDGRR